MQIDWADYHRVHAGRLNLLIHLIAVPLFIGAVVSVLLAAGRGDPVSATMSLAFGLIAMALQGRGHKLEAEPPRPFSGPLNFMRRWFMEQFIIFPVFLLTGRWWRQFMRSGRMDSDES